MALTPEQAREDLIKLQEVAAQLGRTINSLWESDPMYYAKEILHTFIKWDDELKEIQSDLNGIHSIIASNLRELSRSNAHLLEARKHSRQLMSISQKLSADRNEIADLDKKSLEKLIQQTNISSQLLQNTISSRNLSQEEENAALDIYNLGRDILSHAKERLKLEERINSEINLGHRLLEGVNELFKKLGFSKLVDSLGIEQALKNNETYIRKIIKESNKAGVEISSWSLFLKKSSNLLLELGGNINKALGPLYILTELFRSLGNLDVTIGNTAKQFGISYENAHKLTKEINRTAFSTNDVYVTAEKLNNSFRELNDLLGTNTHISDESLITYTQLVEKANYSKQTAEQLFKLRLLTGKSEKQISAEYLGQIKSQNILKNIKINEKSLLNDISNISKATLLVYTSQGQKLGEAAAKAKALGSSLKEIESIANSLLDVESSIYNEFAAEVITGKQLNLERARYYALTNNIGGLAEELNKQGVTALQYGKMNVLQQESYAKALGMSRDQMSNMLIEGESLRKLGFQNVDEARKHYDELKKRLGVEGAIKAMGDDMLAQQFQSQDQATNFQNAMVKLKDIFVQLANPLIPVLEKFAHMAQYTETILKTLIGFKVTMAVINGLSKIQAGFQAAQSSFALTTLSAESGRNKLIMMRKALLAGELAKSIGIAAAWAFANPLMAIAGAAAATLAGYTLWNMAKPKEVNDGIINNQGGLLVSGPKGSIKLDSEDTFIGNKNGIIAGTDLIGDKKGIKNDEKTNNSLYQQPNSTPNISLLTNTLGNKMDVMINKLDTLIGAVNKGMVVNLDGYKVSQELLTPLAINNRNI